MSNEADAKKLYLMLNQQTGPHIPIITAFLDARDSKPPMSEEVRRALVCADWPCSHEGVGQGGCADCEVQQVLAAEVRRLRGEKI
jgi:hypothetical protein